MIENTQKNNAGWRKDILLLALLFGALFFALGGVRPLANPDEGRYCEIPREMIESGDWVSPTLNGLPYFYKPPLFYWMQALSFEAFGLNRFSARFPNTMMALLGVLMTYAFARDVYGRRAGIFSAAVLGTVAMYYAMGQIVTLDMTLSVFLTGVLFSFGSAFRRPPGARRGMLMVLGFAFAALALMTKGFISVLIPGAVLFIFVVIYGVGRFFSRARLSDAAWCAAGAAVFLAIALPWHVLAAQANPPFAHSEGFFSANRDGQGFLWYYVVHEHFLRFVDAETSDRAEPFYFFIFVVAAGFMPWSIIFPQSLRGAFMGGWANVKSSNPQAVALCVWALFITLFFSISRSKLAPYVLPVFPALSVLAGAWLARVWKRPERFRTALMLYIYSAFGLLVSPAPLAAYYICLHKGRLEDPNILPFAALSAAIFAGACLLLLFTRRGSLRAGICALFSTIFAFVLLFNPLAAQLQKAGTEDLVDTIMRLKGPDGVVVCAYDYSEFQDLPFWLGELVTIAGGVPQEQIFGHDMRGREHAHRFLHDNADFDALLRSGRRVLVLLKKDKLDMLDDLEEYSRLKIVDENSRFYLFGTE